MGDDPGDEGADQLLPLCGVHLLDAVKPLLRGVAPGLQLLLGHAALGEAWVQFLLAGLEILLPFPEAVQGFEHGIGRDRSPLEYVDDVGPAFRDLGEPLLDLGQLPADGGSVGPLRHLGP